MEHDSPDIAIIGMACRVAGANSPSELWDNLLTSKHVQRRITRFNVNGFYHPEGGPLKGLTNVEHAYMLDDDAVDKFDNAFFHVNPTEAAAMDPQHRMLLEVSYEAIESAGMRLQEFTGTNTAVFTGTSCIEGSDYHTVLARDIATTPKYIVTGTAGCMASNRLSYFYDLSGPSMTVDTACSSSMAALHQAVRTLQHGDSKMALVCGANLMLNPESFISMTELGFLGASGRCRSFDADADGYGRGEGICCLLLMPLAPASSMQAPIRAVIKGTRLNQDGRTQGITLPSAKAQAQNMSSLYNELSIEPRRIQYLEAHGTGTTAGDPLEMQAVKETYNGTPLVVGSVKSNVGHCEAASALVGLIKTVLCLENEQIPAQMHHKTLAPTIDLTGTNITIPKKISPWPHYSSSHVHTRVAAINTFGAGGTNGHAVLESYAHHPSKVANTRRPWLFKISAADEVSLQSLTESYAAYIEHQAPNLRDLAHTLLAHRTSLQYSRFFVASTQDSLLTQLRSDHQSFPPKGKSTAGQLIYVFTGQGAQWARMGCCLLNHSPLFKDILRECDKTLQGLPEPPSWSIIDVLCMTQQHSCVHDAQYSQPLCTALQIGIVCLLHSWGIRPTAVVGHSSGEIGAAYAAGMISLESAITIAYYRGYVLSGSLDIPSSSTANGSMCAVSMHEDECKSFLGSFHGQLQLAAVNSPQSCTLSGDQEAVQKIVDLCTEQGRFCRKLKVDKGMFSLSQNIYFVRLTKSPVQEILNSHSKPGVPYFSTCKRHTDDFESILQSAGGMIAAGVPLEASSVNAEVAIHDGSWQHQYGNVLTDLPSYKWNHKTSFWSESRVSRNVRHRHFPRHELLGSRYIDDIPSRACWRNNLDLNGIAWVKGLKNEEMPGLSPAICILMAVEAALQTWKFHVPVKSAVRLIDVEFHRSIVQTAASSEQKPFETQLISRMDEDTSRLSFEIFRSAPDMTDDWQLCATGSLEEAPSVQEVGHNDAKDLHHDPLFLQRARYVYPAFGNVENLRVDNSRVSGDIPELQHTWQEYPIAPVALASILSLGPTMLVDQNLPAKHRISLIRMLELCIGPHRSDATRFTIETRATPAGGALSSLVFIDGVLKVIAATLQYAAIETIPPKPTTRSLFFKRVDLPDITKPMAIPELSITDCARLSAHKWPMGDIFLGGMPAEAENNVLGAFEARKSAGRKMCRSLLILGNHEGPHTNDSVRHVRQFSQDHQASIVFVSQCDSVELLMQHLLPHGLVCVCGVQEDLENIFSPNFEYICKVTGLDKGPWTLWRMKKDQPCPVSAGSRVLLSNQNIKLKDVARIDLRPEAVSSFAYSSDRDRFNAILIDDLEKSIITTWAGNDLIPWLQYLMRHAESLLWVTLDTSSSPFVDIAGTLLRTLQAEQPSLKVSWLCLNESQMDEDSVVKNVERAFTSMLQGENEVRQDIDQVGTRIIRYVPDENIAAATGTVVPRKVEHPVGDSNYALALAAPDESVVLSYDPPGQLEESREASWLEDYPRVKVLVAASVISSDDIAAYKGRKAYKWRSDGQVSNSAMSLGTFFAGEVMTSTSQRFPPGSFVVGWTRGAHVNTVDAPETSLYRTYKELQLSAAYLASLAIAMAVLDGHIRARKNDRLLFSNMDLMVSEAFSAACNSLSLGKGEDDNSPTFVVEKAETGQIMVNQTPVDILQYLATNPTSLRSLWDDSWMDQQLSSRPKYFPLKHHKEAFESAATSNEPVVLLHKDLDDMTHVPIYRRPKDLFPPSGAYIIIGGLGGLGRYTCSWLVEHGAVSLYAISRSGISSSEAQELYDNLNSKDGIRLEVIKADACDRTAISSILSDIRRKTPIKGIINMAMILGDAPMASMTGEEWDRALKVKIESSWILHEVTKDDDVEFFVLFSSIASVLGNRNQGSYNVGNTFLNALATYRRRMGLTAVAIALGAMTDIGVLSTYATPTTPLTLTRSGLTHLTTAHLSKILEATFHKSHQQRLGQEPAPESAICITGLEMWESNDSTTKDNKQKATEIIYWRRCPEFSPLSTSTLPSPIHPQPTTQQSLATMLSSSTADITQTITTAFLPFLSHTLGFPPSTFDTSASLATYGLDSLNAVGVQYWCFHELHTTISVAEIFAAGSIAELINTISSRALAGIEKDARKAV
ncbi:MAG: hypothetical protein Q9182_005787 [Xanthomendoza sp. 2 TL-2023]